MVAEVVVEEGEVDMVQKIKFKVTTKFMSAVCQ